MVQGHGGMVNHSILDTKFDPKMTVDQAVALVKECVEQLQKRFAITFDRFCVRVINKDGINTLEDITLPLS